MARTIKFAACCAEIDTFWEAQKKFRINTTQAKYISSFSMKQEVNYNFQRCRSKEVCDECDRALLTSSF